MNVVEEESSTMKLAFASRFAWVFPVRGWRAFSHGTGTVESQILPYSVVYRTRAYLGVHRHRQNKTKNSSCDSLMDLQ